MKYEQSITLTSSNASYDVNFVSTHNPTGNFTIILPGKYNVVNKDNDDNYLDTEGFTSEKLKELFTPSDNTDIIDYGFNSDFLPENVTTYDAIIKFIPVLIGSDYMRILGHNYFEHLFHLYNPIFEKLGNNVDLEKIKEKQAEYKSIIEELPKVLKTILNKYTLLQDVSNKKQLLRNLKIVKHEVLLNKDYSCSEGPFNFKFDFEVYPTTIELYSQLAIAEKIDTDIGELMCYLAKLSELSAYFSKEENSYREFIISMINQMGGNYDIGNYRRDVMNYSIFKWNVDGYPSNTKSKNLYSLRAIITDNKLRYDALTLSNLENLSKALNDLSITETDGNYSNDIKNLKNTLSVVCCLFGIKSELKAHDLLRQNKLLNDIMEPIPLHESRRLVDNEKKILL